VLHESGFTDRVLSPFEEQELLEGGLGITNLVARATATAAEVSRAELQEGARLLENKVADAHPQVVAVLGMEAFRSAFEARAATVGLQPVTLAGARVWLLPNPSGLQATYQLSELVALFSQLAVSVQHL
jgi:TDG/mug DNA glycosylase family protein